MSASIAGRSTILRAFCRATTTTRARISATSCPSIQSNFMPRRSPSSRQFLLLLLLLQQRWYILENAYECNNLIYERLDRLLRRELSSLQPLHSAIASACLISKLPALATSSEGLHSSSLSLHFLFIHLYIFLSFMGLSFVNYDLHPYNFASLGFLNFIIIT